MKKNVIVPVLSVLFIMLYTQLYPQQHKKKDVDPVFNNQGEQEDYWVKQFFKREYKETQFELFAGKVIKENGVFIFSGDSLTVNDKGTETNLLFLKGLLYPALIGGYQVSDIKELKALAATPQKRRFKFLVYRRGLLNPTLCIFELTNTRDNKQTTLFDFIDGAHLTFFKQGWIMI